MRRERTDVILREAAGLASEHGWTALRLEDVARRAGIAKGTIYLDFKDKDELITAAVRRSMDELLALMQQEVDGAEEHVRLDAALALLTRLPVERPDLAALLRWSGSEGPTPDDTLEQVERFLTRLIKRAQVLELVSSSFDPEFAAQAILAAATVPAWTRIATRKGPTALLAQLPFTSRAYDRSSAAEERKSRA
jgi:AcrR family transcriptional regulator